MRKVIFFVFFIVAIFLGYRYLQKFRGPILKQPEFSTVTPSYTGVAPYTPKIHVFAENISQVTHIEITPDGNFMLVGTLPGTIWIYQKADGVFRKQITPFFEVKTAQPGWPPQEAGLTGIVFGADFDTSGDVFLLYSFALEPKSFRNRVLRVTLSKQWGSVIGTNPTQIFEANSPGTGSHQIQDGAGVMIGDKPHLLFTLGEGFEAKRALDPKEEAGKLMLIERDGSAPVGSRPFADNPKVQAIGLRNPPAFAQNPKNQKIALGDTGPSNFDRFLYGTFYDGNGKNEKHVSFNWDGSEESLQKSAKDVYDKEMVLYRWTPTETPVNIAFYENPKLPALGDLQHYILVTLFGRTGEKGNEPGKRILLGTLTEGAQNSIVFQPFIERTKEVAEQLGHPIGLAVDPTTGDIYFGDIVEGRIYKAVVK